MFNPFGGGGGGGGGRVHIQFNLSKNGFNLRTDFTDNIHTYIHTYIHTCVIYLSPKGLFRANETINETTEHNTTTVKNPNWLEANQLAIYKCSREVESGTTRFKLLFFFFTM